MKVFDQDILSEVHKPGKSNLKVVLGLILLIALLSYDRLDPSPLNLLRPVDGISNWFGMPGALVAGCFADLFGVFGFLFPLSLLFLTHNEDLNRRQSVLLDIAVAMTITMGFAQFYPEGEPLSFAGLVGTMSQTYFNEFPGRLIIVLVCLGFLIRYAKHYKLNWQFFTMIQQLGGIFIISFGYLDRIVQTRFGKYIKRFAEYLSPITSKSRDKLTSATESSARRWQSASSRIAGWLLEHNPLYRYPSKSIELTGMETLNEEVKQELNQRKLLSDTIQEFEKRSVQESG